MSRKFFRQDYKRYSKLGKNKKKKRTWRRPKGRDSKMRLSRRNYPASPSIGHKKPKSQSGRINGLMPVVISNAGGLKLLKKNEIAVLSSKLGAKKKLDIIKKAEEMKIKVLNLGRQK